MTVVSLLTPRIDVLVATANHEHERAMQAGAASVEHAIKCGEALASALTMVPHGKRIVWLRESFIGSEDVAYKYMKIARNQEKVRAARATSIRDAWRCCREPLTQEEIDRRRRSADRRRRALRLLGDQEQDKAMRAIGGSVAKAWTLQRRAAQELQRSIDQAEGEEKRLLERAYASQRRAEDDLVRILGLEKAA
jgi:hypothetical protein